MYNCELDTPLVHKQIMMTTALCAPPRLVLRAVHIFSIGLPGIPGHVHALTAII